MKNKIAIVGGGPAGCCAACFLNDNVTIFEKNEPLKTLLYTGGGRCNLANAIYDFKQLAKNYPRGEKFLYSIFSKFSTEQTVDFFKSIGVETYVQNDNRIFPKSDSAGMVREAILKKIERANFIREKVCIVEKKQSGFLVNRKYFFENVVIATGGHAGYDIVKNLGHDIVEPKPALVGLITQEKFNLEGVSLKNVASIVSDYKKPFCGDLIFTKNGISGPLAYIVSSVFAREKYSKLKPIKLYLDFKAENLAENIDRNGKKELRNIVSQYVPKSLAEYICGEHASLRGCEVTKEIRKNIAKSLSQFEITIVGHERHGEVVTCGGVSLKEIDSKTMESKIHKGLYFCGEVIDVDGFCGGFNLQNAWSTAYVVASSINKL